jgi:K+-sensing histidine kinase KdpD
MFNGLLLINNAVKFTDNGIVEIGIKEQDCHVVFYVTDSGIGIPHEKMNVIFERFSQVNNGHEREHERLGIGLSIVKAYAEKLGTHLWVQSEINKGSTFYLSFKKDEGVIEKQEIQEEKRKSCSGKKKDGLIPVAEDDVLIKPINGDKLLDCIDENFR